LSHYILNILTIAGRLAVRQTQTLPCGRVRGSTIPRSAHLCCTSLQIL